MKQINGKMKKKSFVDGYLWALRTSAAGTSAVHRPHL